MKDEGGGEEIGDRRIKEKREKGVSKVEKRYERKEGVGEGKSRQRNLYLK